MQEFDSINQELHALYDEVDPTTGALYDSIAGKHGKIYLHQFRVTVSDCKNYLKHLRSGFIVHCGAIAENTIPEKNESNTVLSNQFFIDQKNGENLYYKLDDVERILLIHNDDPQLDEEIHQMIYILKGQGAAGFAQTYFNDTPPVAALTILRKFQNDIDRLEKKVLENMSKRL